MRDGEKGWLREEIEVINTYAKSGIVPKDINYQNRPKNCSIESNFDKTFFSNYMKEIIEDYDQINFDIELSGDI